MIHKLAFMAAACSLAPTALAQATVAVTALTPIAASVHENGVAYLQTLPAGPLGTSVVLNSQAPSPSASRAGFSSYYSTASDSVLFSCSIAAAAASSTADTSLGLAELLLTISAPVTTGVAIDVSFLDQTLAGSRQPRIDVDLFNDGSIDYLNGVQIVGLPAITVGPQPLEMRLILDAHASQFERSTCSLSILVRPLTGADIFQTAQGCAGALNSLIVRRSFLPQAVYFRRDAIGQSPLLVLGFAAQPMLLPPPSGPLCLLVPSIDAVIPMSLQQFDLTVPQAVRPLSFEAQAVAISFGNLVVTDAFHISTY